MKALSYSPITDDAKKIVIFVVSYVLSAEDRKHTWN